MGRYVKYRNKFRQYFWNHMICLDQWFNVTFGGDPDETMSSRMGKRSRESCAACYWICKFLNVFEDDHCAVSIERDRGFRDVIR